MSSANQSASGTLGPASTTKTTSASIPELDRVRVMADAGKVTLNGMVPTSADAASIEQKIRALDGVSAVDNQIEVLH